MKYLKIFFSFTVAFLLCALVSTNVSAKEIDEEVTTQATASTDESWKMILDHLDIDIEYLEPNKYLGLYWDSFANGKSTDGYLYLCWISQYYTNTSNTILQFKESGSTYSLYSNTTQMNNKEGNWLSSLYKQYPNYNLTLYMTPIGGIKDGQNFGIRLKRTYNFTNIKYGYEGTNKAIGQISESITFDLGMEPENNGKNSMQLCTHGYEIIKDCEVQSYFDLIKYGGYGHFAYFNTTLKIDKIYRVDVAYKVLNDDKPWYQFFLPNDEHQITKSLTTKRISGGIFGLFQFQGFKEGSYQSTKSSAINYKYRLHLNYDDEAWNIFVGKEYYEADYRRVSEFQIIRMNYVIDGKTYDVPIKMDTIEGDTLFILDPDLILDTDSPYYDLKKLIDDFFRKAKDKLNNYKIILIIIASTVGGIFLIALIIRFIKIIKAIIGPNEKERKDDDSWKKS